MFNDLNNLANLIEATNLDTAFTRSACDALRTTANNIAKSLASMTTTTDSTTADSTTADSTTADSTTADTTTADTTTADTTTAEPLTIAETANPLTIEAVEKVLTPYAFDYFINDDDDFNHYDFHVKAETFDCIHFNAVCDKLRIMPSLYLHSVFCSESFTIVYFFNKYGASPSMMIALILRKGGDDK